MRRGGIRQALCLSSLALLLGSCQKNAAQQSSPPPMRPPAPQTPAAAPQQQNSQQPGTCPQLFAGGELPRGRGALQLICHQAIAIGLDPSTRLAAYSAEHLDHAQQRGHTPRRSEFEPDPALPASLQVSSGAYTRSGYDRGHLSPAADFRGNPQGMTESFYTSNVAPQNPVLNREAWAGLESAVRACTRSGALYVVTGVTPGQQHLKRAPQLPVPDAFWKFISDGQRYRLFLFPNVSTPKVSSYRAFEKTLDDLVRAGGADPDPSRQLRQDPRLCRGFL